MPRSYTPEFKKKIVRLHLDEGRTYKSITAEYGVSKASISAWCTDFTYLFLANHEVRYNCTIILRPRSAIYVQSMYRIL